MDWIVIMAGGGGTRLWPLSRRKRPKQFLSLLPGDETLIGATVRRAGRVVPIERTLVVTAASQVEEVRRTVPSLPEGNIVIEPEGRNTAPCIGLATVEVLRRDESATIGVLPSDQYVGDDNRFAAALQQALRTAAHGPITTVGIRPDSPETGFGYIQMGQSSPEDEDGGAHRVRRFVEKPDRATAEQYVASGEYLWNAGMFFFRGTRMLEEITHHMPALGGILAALQRDPSRAAEIYPTAPRISIDYGVIEKLPTDALRVVPGDFAWNDVGSFAAIAEVRPRDGAANATIGEAIAIDARDNVLIGGDKLIAAVGVEGLIVVATDDAVLVIPKSRAQEVRRIVEALESRKRDRYL